MWVEVFRPGSTNDVQHITENIEELRFTKPLSSAQAPGHPIHVQSALPTIDAFISPAPSSQPVLQDV
jgi:hypothetical protein